MELIRGFTHLRERHRGSVVTVGTFDGLHLGHQALISRLKNHAERLGRPATLLTFEPTPREFLASEDPPARLTSFRERWRLLQGMGLESVWLLRFCDALRRMSGDEFARLLAQELRAPTVVVGHDFRFGRNGESTAAGLVEAGRGLGFTVEVVEPVMLNGDRVSSSGIRAALARGDLEFARRWLGRAYSMRGRVIRGNQLGRTLGFPTANLRVERRRVALSGIFAVRVHGATGPSLSGVASPGAGRPAPAAGLPGVASLGTRPTVAGVETLLEAHVFDFSGDLYGREIEVEFVAKLRDEERFDSLDALTDQMNRDAAQARSILN
ncbi:MAG TPA: bifunctional riboflavin kinase/FAD synthetase [Steroidobacteraceae bacterium]|jgi:riboflavin kinase/FMN adenylyltransferase